MQESRGEWICSEQFNVVFFRVRARLCICVPVELVFEKITPAKLGQLAGEEPRLSAKRAERV